jgi:predicted secreted protein
MSERPPKSSVPDVVPEERLITDKEEVKVIKIAVAEILFQSQESFPFPGLKPEEYAKIKEQERECPEYSTPIDELLERFRSEGMKIVLGKNPKSGNVFVLPAGSEDIEMDSLFPRHLRWNAVLDSRVNALIEMDELD